MEISNSSKFVVIKETEYEETVVAWEETQEKAEEVAEYFSHEFYVAKGTTYSVYELKKAFTKG